MKPLTFFSLALLCLLTNNLFSQSDSSWNTELSLTLDFTPSKGSANPTIKIGKSTAHIGNDKPCPEMSLTSANIQSMQKALGIRDTVYVQNMTTGEVEEVMILNSLGANEVQQLKLHQHCSIDPLTLEVSVRIVAAEITVRGQTFVLPLEQAE